MGYDLRERALGAYLGLAIGDALGATVEFMSPTEIREEYGVHRNMTGGGWLHLRPGQVTDDTQMCLVLGRSILADEQWSVTRFGEGMVQWLRSHPVDVGNTCRRGIRRFMLNGSTAAEPAEWDAGNGACVRNLPAVLATLSAPATFRRISVEQAHLTHHHPLSDVATLTLGEMLRCALRGEGVSSVRRLADALVARYPEFAFKEIPQAPTPYIVDTVRAVLYALLHTDNFKDCLIAVVNQGGDADTTGALAGMLAGGLYGTYGLPGTWLQRLDPAVQKEIAAQVDQLLIRGERTDHEQLPASMPPRIVFYEKPGCANNARQIALLRAAGCVVEVHDLLQTAWTAETLRPYFSDRPVAEWFNPASPRVKSGEIVPEAFTEAGALAAMLLDPLLIRRPLMEAGDAKIAGFSEDQLRRWTSASLDVYAEDTGAATDSCRRSVPCPSVRQASNLTKTPAASSHANAS
ncbi:ADP-ribosyl-[dinitrogen reductase] hydrolase [Acidithiobacillus ferrooxidans]|uniref:ADP-ribosyl-[dinitrogen reductase] hydrolase n=1 Tax=Acidithiobacillus ferrooxidans TaxID=920 RepID=UPI0013D24691|nr:ADP-ribosyl-[dinitrogen reductase] hydrolase [Acidithiobacillus ferrooxidans]MCR2828935.1 ADP-ribosyl-[dinitrogen reductase] hydrolase [Acidithiobacillus ferrooxidans]